MQLKPASVEAPDACWRKLPMHICVAALEAVLSLKTAEKACVVWHNREGIWPVTQLRRHLMGRMIKKTSGL